jgi:hypothetical protein
VDNEQNLLIVTAFKNILLRETGNNRATPRRCLKNSAGRAAKSKLPGRPFNTPAVNPKP